MTGLEKLEPIRNINYINSPKSMVYARVVHFVVFDSSRLIQVRSRKVYNLIAYGNMAHVA